MIIKAFDIQDILQGIDYGSDQRSKSCTPAITNFDNNTGTVDLVTSCAGSKNAWVQRVQFLDYYNLVSEEEKANINSYEELKSKYPEIIYSDIKVFCGCPAYIFYGFQYIDYQLDFGLTPENRPPDIRNPGQEGTVCKHLISALEYLL